MCFGNQHTFTWGSSTATDSMPLSLRCECGAISREDVNPFKRLEAENTRLRSENEQLYRRLRGLTGICEP